MSRRRSIAVNTRFLIKDKLEGIGLFTAESLRRIVQAHPEVDFYFLFDRPYSNEFVFGSNVTPVVLFPPARHPLLWYWWFEISVRRWLNKHKPDLFLSADGYACLGTTVPQVAVMHDLSFEHFKEHVPFLSAQYYKYFMPRFAHKATRIATVSEFSKNDIVKHYQIDAAKIDVVYNGAKEVYEPVSDEVKQRVKSKLTEGKEYFIYVGSIHPRKNVKNLLLAFEQFKQQTNSDFKLLIVGRKAWHFGEVEETHANMKFRSDVIFAGHVPPQQLGEVVASAYAMIYVSLFEGFGIPIIEAMSCRVPVITSNVTSMPEAAGEAALLVNPASVSEITGAMEKLYRDKELRKALIEKGKEQLKKFGWNLTAEKLWQCCEKVLNRISD
ncbi:MAG: glycosyltransferase family 4 protein [Chitinophagales bacterium]|nr:glycosyltransferase family 4 protein [Chitinophagales bacterium]